MIIGQFLELVAIRDCHNSRFCRSLQYKICRKTPVFVDAPEDLRAFVKQAASQLGMTIPELSERMGYASLARAMNGEIAFPEARLIHLQDLVNMAQKCGTDFVKKGPGTEPSVVADDISAYSIRPADDSEIIAQIIELLSFYQDSKTMNRAELLAQAKRLLDSISPPRPTQSQRQSLS